MVKALIYCNKKEQEREEGDIRPKSEKKVREERERVECLYYDKKAEYSPELFEWLSNSYKILQA